MGNLVGHLLVFGALACVALLVPLIVGRLIRPRIPTPEKDAVYECGEPTIGSSYIQFDLRFYVVALLFIIFDVEVAFFFPWSSVYGNAMQLADNRLSDESRLEISNKVLNLKPTNVSTAFPSLPELDARIAAAEKNVQTVMEETADARKSKVNAEKDAAKGLVKAAENSLTATQTDRQTYLGNQNAITAKNALKLGWVALADMLVFFGVLLVGFAYVWKRGDLDWVRAVASAPQQAKSVSPPVNPSLKDQTLIAKHTP